MQYDKHKLAHEFADVYAYEGLAMQPAGSTHGLVALGTHFGVGGSVGVVGDFGELTDLLIRSTNETASPALTKMTRETNM